MTKDKFRGLVYTKFKSAEAMGKTIGWPKQKTHRIMQRRQEMTVTDFAALARTLEIKEKDWDKLVTLIYGEQH